MAAFSVCIFVRYLLDLFSHTVCVNISVPTVTLIAAIDFMINIHAMHYNFKPAGMGQLVNQREIKDLNGLSQRQNLVFQFIVPVTSTEPQQQTMNSHPGCCRAADRIMSATDLFKVTSSKMQSTWKAI